MGYLLTEASSHILDEAGNLLLDEAGIPVLPFPQTPLDLRCELNLGGTWTDISSYAYQRDGTSPPVTITRGRPDESSQANPAACSWQWNNRDGRFSPKNPLSPYYGQLGRNTPVRWSVPSANPYLRLENNAADRAYVSDKSSLRISGSLEMRIELHLTDWQGCILAHKWDGGACWYWQLQANGTLLFGWLDSSAVYHTAASTQPVPFAPGTFALRMTMNVTTGTVTFYTASSVDGTYTQLGSAVSGTNGAATTIATTTGAALTVGYSFDVPPAQLFGQVHEYRLYNGIGGTVVADGIFTAQTAGAASWTDAQGNLWQLAGSAEISQRSYRFHGEMSALPPKWDVTGTDHWVAAQAGGPLRRLGQGSSNAMSAMKRAILLQSGSLAPVAYWPMEDAAGATFFGSALGGPAMTFDPNPAPVLATDSSFLCSAPLPQVNASRLRAEVPAFTDTGTWTIRFLLKMTTPSATTTLMQVASSGPCDQLAVSVNNAANFALTGYSSGTQVFTTGFVSLGPTVLTEGIWFSLEAQPVSGGVQYSVVGLSPGSAVGYDFNQTVSGTTDAGTVSLVQLDSDGGFTSTVMGHLQVQSAWTSLFNLSSPLNAWVGESAGARYARLAGENGYQARIIGTPGQSAPMGAQTQATLGDLLAECETADLGQQFEPRQQTALGYRTLASMVNQATPVLTLDYSQAEPGGVSGDGGDSGLDPTYDDMLLRNDWTVTRGAASGNQGATVQVQLDDGSATSVSDPPTGAGDYASTQTSNVELDNMVIDVAGWLVSSGSVDEARWPLVPVNLARPQLTSLQQAAMDLDVGGYLELVNAPDVILYDPVQQLVLGLKESLGGFHWMMEYNAIPAAAYSTAVLDDAVLGAADTDGSQLASGVSSAATTLSVSTTGPSGVIWTTNAADLPFDISAGGERMTVTAVSGASSPQSFTVTRSVNGVVKAHLAGETVRLQASPNLAYT
jgi:hypothetical protein